jgi:hypothetical protein
VVHPPGLRPDTPASIAALLPYRTHLAVSGRTIGLSVFTNPLAGRGIVAQRLQFVGGVIKRMGVIHHAATILNLSSQTFVFALQGEQRYAIMQRSRGLQDRGELMSEDGHQVGIENGAANGRGSAPEVEPEAEPVERVISDVDAAREVGANVAEDDPDLEYKLSVYRYEEQPEEAFPDVDYSRVGENAQPRPKSGRSVGDILTIVLLIGIPIAIALLLLTISQSNRQQQQNASVAQTPTPIYYAKQLPIVGHNEAPQSDGTVAIDVTVLNNGGIPVMTVNVLVRLLDDKGDQVGSGIIPIQNIAPGATGMGQVSIKPSGAFAHTEYLISSIQTNDILTPAPQLAPTAVGP